MYVCMYNRCGCGNCATMTTTNRATMITKLICLLNACTLSSSFPESLWPVHSLTIAAVRERERGREQSDICLCCTLDCTTYVRIRIQIKRKLHILHIYLQESYRYVFCLGASLTDYLHMTRPTHDSTHDSRCCALLSATRYRL